MNAATTLVQTSWMQVLPTRDRAAELFYVRLFELSPCLRPLFEHDMQDRGRVFLATISVAVANLERPSVLLPALGALGARHDTCGFKDHHFDVVGRALVDTLHRCLGEAFTPETKAAWVASYNGIANVMRTAAADHCYAAA